MLVDANILLFAEDRSSAHHKPAVEWLTAALNGSTRVGLPWPSLLAFVRIRTHRRVYERPLTVDEAWARVEEWLGAPAAWVPVPTSDHAAVLGALVRRYRLTGIAVPDGHLAALAIEHGLTVCSTDTDFARFTDVRWFNPIAGR